MTNNIYLYTGSEAGERNDAINNVKTQFKKKYAAVEEYLFFASETSACDIIGVLQNENLFSDATCVLVKHSECIKKKEDIDAVTNWIKTNSSESSLLILTSDENSISSAIEKLIPRENKKVFYEMFENQKVPWLMNYFGRNNLYLGEEAAQAILELVSNDTQSLKSECSKFFVCFSKNHEVTEDDVESVLTHNKEENAFSLFDCMASYDKDTDKLTRALEILQKIRLSKDSSPVLIIAGLASCFRKVGTIHRLYETGTNDDFNMRLNGFASKKVKALYERARRVWKSGQVQAILAVLGETDIALRNGGTLLEDIYLQKMLYEIIIKKGASCATYEL